MWDNKKAAFAASVQILSVNSVVVSALFRLAPCIPLEIIPLAVRPSSIRSWPFLSLPDYLR